MIKLLKTENKDNPLSFIQTGGREMAASKQLIFRVVLLQDLFR